MIIKPTSALRTELGEITRICKGNLRAKLLEAEQQRLSGAPTYTTDDVREYIRGLHKEQV